MLFVESAHPDSIQKKKAYKIFVSKEYCMIEFTYFIGCNYILYGLPIICLLVRYQRHKAWKKIRSTVK